MGILIQAAADWLHFRFSPTQTVLRSALQLTEQKKYSCNILRRHFHLFRKNSL